MTDALSMLNDDHSQGDIIESAEREAGGGSVIHFSDDWTLEKKNESQNLLNTSSTSVASSDAG